MPPQTESAEGDSIRRTGRFGLRWADPVWTPLQGLDEAALRSQHEEISKTIWSLATALALGCLFCCVMLASPDDTLVSADARITIPIASLVISYSNFLLLAPVFLIGMTLYLHVFIEQLIRIRLTRGPAAAAPGSALFNLDQPAANILSAFLFYGMLPCTLAFFVWKTVPRPDASWILLLFLLATCSMMLALGIRRGTVARDGAPARPPRLLWVLLGISVLSFLAVASASAAAWAAYGSPRPVSVLLRVRRLQLFGAQLDKKNLNEFYAPYADLRKALLQDADLEGADLSHADLRNAHLENANLTRVDLTGARMEGAKLTTARLDGALLKDITIDEKTEIDEKWRIVSCIASGKLTPDCLGRPNLAWLDLSHANLTGANLAGVEVTGANLRFADLTGSNLGGVILRVADLRNTTWAPNSGAITDGALLSGSVAKNAPASVRFVNYWTGACLAGPRTAENMDHPVMVWPCGDKATSPDIWKVRRVPSSAFTLQASAPAGSSCLDTTFDSEVHMWGCGPDAATQEWHIVPVKGQNVWIQKPNTNVCLHGGDSREGSPTPWLAPCDPIDHHLQWVITLPDAPAGRPAPAGTESTIETRRADSAATARSFMVSPWGGGSGYGEYRGEFGSAYWGGPEYRWRPEPGSGQRLGR